MARGEWADGEAAGGRMTGAHWPLARDEEETLRGMFAQMDAWPRCASTRETATVGSVADKLRLPLPAFAPG